jgi:hypothetical protein
LDPIKGFNISPIPVSCNEIMIKITILLRPRIVGGTSEEMDHRILSRFKTSSMQVKKKKSRNPICREALKVRASLTKKLMKILITTR